MSTIAPASAPVNPSAFELGVELDRLDAMCADLAVARGAACHLPGHDEEYESAADWPSWTDLDRWELVEPPAAVEPEDADWPSWTDLDRWELVEPPAAADPEDVAWWVSESARLDEAAVNAVLDRMAFEAAALDCMERCLDPRDRYDEAELASAGYRA